MEMGGGPTLQSLLCLAWLAATLPIAAAALPIPAAAGGRLLQQLLCTFSSRGKTVRAASSSSSKQRFTVPQKFFLHFYVVGVVVTTSLLLAIWFYAYMKMTPLMPEPSSYSMIARHLVGSSNSFSLANFWSPRPMEHKYRVWRTVFVLILMEVQV
ncbi:hypothetical protein SEVIR_3G162432v4 [Setaria viridis]|uniref:Uncharacterized protein n=1 Tax=Setaria viridis TaxID=4556 RepID=A0A4U6V9U2_SETVI|nr:hypothetical protein SEVIR_3G162432v2 [Setaria viridis]